MQSKSLTRKALNQGLRDAAAELVRRHGSVLLLDVCQGTINKMLVSKGIVTSDELRDAYMTDVQKALRHSDEAEARATTRVLKKTQTGKV